MSIYATNMTHAEHFRVNGTLPAERIEALLDIAANEDQFIGNWVDTIQEARGCYVPEDFLQSRISDLHYLAKFLRGANRQSLLEIITAMEDDIREQVQSSEYGADELGKILRACK